MPRSLASRPTTGRRLEREGQADSEFVTFIERQLAGAIGAASARIMVASVLREEMHDIDEVTRILDEASQLVVSSRRLEEKSRELEAATAELKAANERLKELDKLKDDFMATVSHEIRTPLTSIRSFSEILRDNPELDAVQRQEFVTIIVNESERLSRLINDILDLAKMEAGTGDWQIGEHQPAPIIEQALAATSGLLARSPNVKLDVSLAKDLPAIRVDPDRLIQVIVNLVSNAFKFCDREQGLISIRAFAKDGYPAGRCAGQRHRHCAREPGQDLRTLPAGGQHVDRQAAGHGSWIADQPTNPAAFRR